MLMKDGNMPMSNNSTVYPNFIFNSFLQINWEMLLSNFTNLEDNADIIMMKKSYFEKLALVIDDLSKT